MNRRGYTLAFLMNLGLSSLVLLSSGSGWYAAWNGLSEFGLHKYSSMLLVLAIVVHVALHVRMLTRRRRRRKGTEMPKPWQTSRTLWVNGGLTLVFALGLVGQLAGAFAIDPRYVALAGAAAAIVNFWLRLDTTAPIQGTPAAIAAEQAPLH